MCQSIFMTLKLHDDFSTKHDFAEIKQILCNKDFHEKRLQNVSSHNIVYQQIYEEEFEVTQILEVDIPPAAKSLVSNPINIIENWKFNESIIEVKITTPNIDVNLTSTFIHIKLDQNYRFSIDTTINSKVFLVGSFVEEFISKFWKKELENNLALLESH